MRFDWKDGLLVACGFIAFVVGLTALKEGLGVDLGDRLFKAGAIAALVGPSAVRRALFGAPQLPEPRTGALASVLSMIGLLATFFGIPILLLGGVTLSRAFEPMPDFEAEQREFHDLNDPTEKMLFENRVGTARTEWSNRRSEQRSDGLIASFGGAALIGMGAVASWLRYRPRTE